MKDEEITTSTVDDFIRAEKKAGKREIHWGEIGRQAFRLFFEANAPCPFHGYGCMSVSCFSLEQLEVFMKENFKEGMTFMGIKHYNLI